MFPHSGKQAVNRLNQVPPGTGIPLPLLLLILSFLFLSSLSSVSFLDPILPTLSLFDALITPLSPYPSSAATALTAFALPKLIPLSPNRLCRPLLACESKLLFLTTILFGVLGSVPATSSLLHHPSGLLVDVCAVICESLWLGAGEPMVCTATTWGELGLGSLWLSVWLCEGVG